MPAKEHQQEEGVWIVGDHPVQIGDVHERTGTADEVAAVESHSPNRIDDLIHFLILHRFGALGVKLKGNAEELLTRAPGQVDVPCGRPNCLEQGIVAAVVLAHPPQASGGALIGRVTSDRHRLEAREIV